MSKKQDGEVAEKRMIWRKMKCI